MPHRFPEREVGFRAPLPRTDDQRSGQFVELPIYGGRNTPHVPLHIIRHIVKALGQKVFFAYGADGTFIGSVVVVQALIAYEDILAVQQAFIGHGARL